MSTRLTASPWRPSAKWMCSTSSSRAASLCAAGMSPRSPTSQSSRGCAASPSSTRLESSFRWMATRMWQRGVGGWRRGRRSHAGCASTALGRAPLRSATARTTSSEASALVLLGQELCLALWLWYACSVRLHAKRESSMPALGASSCGPGAVEEHDSADAWKRVSGLSAWPRARLGCAPAAVGPDERAPRPWRTNVREQPVTCQLRSSRRHPAVR
mmetsp:Transcript_31254/g.93272  ORF Transcript_31254/g.93272 Transcript_31254/m.93272 type:complete len:215 (-) Transcript_31254:334-978(-)|eukprot:121066-Chlamydomonas_euryale.AAC.6